jgi:hypothetical protein
VQRQHRHGDIRARGRHRDRHRRHLLAPQIASAKKGGVIIEVSGRGFWAAKREEAVGEWEDGCALSARRLRFAVADGAGAGFESRQWALTLATTFVRDPPSAGIGAAGVAGWFSQLAERYRRRSEPAAEEDAWLYEAMELRGSFAAFVAVQFWPRPDQLLGWEAMAVGDCCLFHLRRGRLLTAFPVTSAEDFTSHPDLVPSAHHALHRLAARIRITGGTASPGDRFALASDAMSQWLLRSSRRRPDTWLRLEGLRSSSFRGLVRAEREAGRMQRDDVTLAYLRVTVRPPDVQPGDIVC